MSVCADPVEPPPWLLLYLYLGPLHPGVLPQEVTGQHHGELLYAPHLHHTHSNGWDD